MKVLFIKEMIFAFLQHITFILKHEAFNTVDALIHGYRANDELFIAQRA